MIRIQKVATFVAADKELETLSELLMSGILDKENLTLALQALFHDKIIDQDACERLGKLLEVAFKERVKT